MFGLKLEYLFSSTTSLLSGQGFACPSCGASDSEVVSRKYAVTTLRRCGSCRLLYRAPTSPPLELHRCYNGSYRSGLTTTMPDEITLTELKRRGFAGTEKCFDRYIAILRGLGLAGGARILDYGCSWGYGAWQLERAGFEVVGFEVSTIRAAYARDRMGIEAVTERTAVRGRFDAVFFAHVLEHVPSVADVIDWSLQRLRPAGLLVAVTPNGSAPFRASHPRRWDRLWGQVHPNFLDAEYYQAKFSQNAYFLSSQLGRADLISAWACHRRQACDDLSGWELLAVCEA